MHYTELKIYKYQQQILQIQPKQLAGAGLHFIQLNSTRLNRPPKGGYKRKEANSLYISPFLKYTVNLSFKSVNRVRINY